MTLCGDAGMWDSILSLFSANRLEAHPMTPHRGQGLNNAVLDCSYFIAAIQEVASGTKTLKDAIDTYDKEVAERGEKEIQLSLKQTMFIHDWEKMMSSPMIRMGMNKSKTEAA
jgi:2-polyprenyl-6-methoxyphenol hydroxylase-like FAD-dependent oxidoreductase